MSLGDIGMWMVVETTRVCAMRMELRERRDAGKENEVQQEGNQ